MGSLEYNSQPFAIENYRSFKKKFYLNFKPFTLITGPNGSGKSTYTDIVKLYEKHFSDGKIPRKIPLSDLTNDKKINQIANWESEPKKHKYPFLVIDKAKILKVYLKKHINIFDMLSNEEEGHFNIKTNKYNGDE